MMGVLAVTEMALSLAGIPHKKGGVQAAMDYIVSAHSAARARRRSRLSSPAKAGIQNHVVRVG